MIPATFTCPKGHRLPNEKHPDDGVGWTDPQGKKFYFVGTYNAFVIDELTKAGTALVHAYALTGDKKYAAKAALILDHLARTYPASDKGSWDYPSDPPSGRFNRPWYQVARMLIWYANQYDILLMGDALDAPSSVEGMTRRQNIEQNLLLNGARYCYERSVLDPPTLNNGQADYIRGVLAVGVAMGIPQYVAWGVDGPFSIRNMIENNIDSDGQYYETSSGYAHHSRYLYMNMVELLETYRDERHPDGMQLARNPKFRALFLLPQARLDVAGFQAMLGDDGVLHRRANPTHALSAEDYNNLMHLRALSSDPAEREQLAELARTASQSGPESTDTATPRSNEWLLFHADAPPTLTGATPAAQIRHPLTNQPLSASDLLNARGLALLRTGSGRSATAVTLRAGPTLNHGHLDELNLNIYARGYQLTYDLGFGLGSTHTQVGWAKQTASHSLVLVDETSQLKAPGSGGTIERFLARPGLSVVTADDPAAYAAQKVTRYRRTVALIDASPQESYVLDIFRVAGGSQHDYVFHGRGTGLSVEGVEPGQRQPGSLAAPDIDWGARLGVDGDVVDVPNKPYWNPPPGNGFGFLLGPRFGKPSGVWSATWAVNDDPKHAAKLRLTMLPGDDTTLVTAEAPGILPHFPRAAYVLARRRSETSGSTFAAVIEPHGIQRAIAKVEPLGPMPVGASAAVGVMVTLTDGRVDYLFELDPSQQQEWPDAKLSATGGFGKVSTDADGRVQEIVLAGTSQLRFGDITIEQSPRVGGAIERVDVDRHVLYTRTPLPQGTLLAGEFVTIGNKHARRRGAYRIARVEREGDLTAIYLAPTTLVLARGRMGSDPADPRTLPNIVLLEFARSVTHQPTGFFNGRTIATPDGSARTVITGTDRSGRSIAVQSSDGFRGGDELVIYDVQAGDDFELACWAQLTRGADGGLHVRCNAPLTVRRGERVTEVEPTAQGAVLPE